MLISDIKGRKIWQVGEGNTNRQYGDLCLKHDVMIAGPGDPGPFREDLYSDQGDIRNSIRRLCSEATRGDLVLLRRGTGTILAVGEIADDSALWLPAFKDVDGWDLQHARRVRWFSNTECDFPAKTLGGQVRTFAAVNVPLVRDWVHSLTIPDEAFSRELKSLPREAKSIDINELGRLLFIEGLPSEYVDKLMETFSSLQRIASWYKNEEKRPQGRPSEQETICYLVMPLLFSLGWSQQTAAIEWNNVDIALFREMPPTDASLARVVEAKTFGYSVFSPVGQAQAYALQPGRSNCDRLIVTNGISYTVHKREGEQFKLYSYLNILKICEDCPLFDCQGAVATILDIAR